MPRGPGRPPRSVALLFLFDGVGTARVALVDVLRVLRAPPLVGAHFAEDGNSLAAAVQAAWQDATDRRGGVAYLPIARDVSDLTRDGGAAVRRLVDSLPSDTLLLVVAGPPCVQLTPAAPCGCPVGVCGRESVAAFAIPLISAAAAAVRTDVVENAGSLQQVHRAALGTLAGVPAERLADLAPRIDAGEWSPSPPPCTFFSTLPPGPWQQPRHGGGVWEEDWRRVGSGTMPKMMRSRTVVDGRPTGPAYQRRPPNMVGARVRAAMPHDLRAGWDAVVQGAFQGPASYAALQAATWLTAHGPGMGIRTPSVVERARGLGIGANMASLGLADTVAYDAQGNSFDYRALSLRIGHGIRAWLAGCSLPPTAWPDAAELARLFQDLRSGVLAGVGPLAEGPFPEDVAARVLAGAPRAVPGPTGDQGADAAGSGRARREALGRPAVVPSARCPGWQSARWELERDLREAGVPAAVRSPAALLRLLNQGTLRRRMTWGERGHPVRGCGRGGAPGSRRPE